MKSGITKINPKMLQWARRKACFTDSIAAYKIGVSIQKYREWESGQSVPSTSQLRRIACALKCPVMVFLCLGLLK
jgi:DNA-binding XRE family transcriptional regulator